MLNCKEFKVGVKHPVRREDWILDGLTRKTTVTGAPKGRRDTGGLVDHRGDTGGSGTGPTSDGE